VICPSCLSTNVRIQFGPGRACSETGYVDDGERLSCLDCDDSFDADEMPAEVIPVEVRHAA
jgi:hypothetical protein